MKGIDEELWSVKAISWSFDSRADSVFSCPPYTVTQAEKLIRSSTCAQPSHVLSFRLRSQLGSSSSRPVHNLWDLRVLRSLGRQEGRQCLPNLWSLCISSTLNPWKVMNPPITKPDHHPVRYSTAKSVFQIMNPTMRLSNPSPRFSNFRFSWNDWWGTRC